MHVAPAIIYLREQTVHLQVHLQDLVTMEPESLYFQKTVCAFISPAASVSLDVTDDNVLLHLKCKQTAIHYNIPV